MMTIEDSTQIGSSKPCRQHGIGHVAIESGQMPLRPKIACKARKEKSHDMRRLCLAVMPSIWLQPFLGVVVERKMAHGAAR